MDWDKIDDKLKTPEEKQAEREQVEAARKAEIRGYVREVASRIVPDLQRLQLTLAARAKEQVSLEYGGRRTRVVVGALSIGFEVSEDGLSFAFIVDGNVRPVLFNRQQGFEHWQLQGSPTNQPFDVDLYFEREVHQFVDRVPKK